MHAPVGNGALVASCESRFASNISAVTAEVPLLAPSRLFDSAGSTPSFTGLILLPAAPPPVVASSPSVDSTKADGAAAAGASVRFGGSGV